MAATENGTQWKQTQHLFIGQPDKRQLLFINRLKDILSNTPASSPKTLGIRGDEFLSVSHLVSFWFLYLSIAQWLLRWLHCNHRHIRCSWRAGNVSVPSPSCLHPSAQAKEFLLQCLLNRIEFVSQAGARGPILELSLRGSNTCILSYFP